MKVERPRARSSAAPTRENSRSTTPILRAARRHEAAHLRQHRDQRVLAQKGRFARHVRSGEQRRCGLPLAGGGGERSQSLATNGPPSAASACSTTGWRPALDDEVEASIDLRPHIVALGGERGERGRDVERGERLGGRLDRGAAAATPRREIVEGLELDAERALGGAGDLRLELAKLGGGEAYLAGERLAVDEGRVERGRQKLVAVLRGHLDEIAEHVVVPDLQRAHAGRRRRSAPASAAITRRDSSRSARASSSAAS